MNKGPYSEVFGIPVALLGVIGYAFLFLGSLLRARQPEDVGLRWFLLLAASGGLAFSLYLTSLEAFVLRTWCVVCLASQVLMISIFILTLLSWREPSR